MRGQVRPKIVLCNLWVHEINSLGAEEALFRGLVLKWNDEGVIDLLACLLWDEYNTAYCPHVEQAKLRKRASFVGFLVFA